MIWESGDREGRTGIQKGSPQRHSEHKEDSRLSSTTMVCKESLDEAMPRKIRQLIKDLKKAGWEIDHISGSHRIFKHQKVGGHVSLAGKDGDDARPYEEKNVREAIRRSESL